MVVRGLADCPNPLLETPCLVGGMAPGSVALSSTSYIGTNVVVEIARSRPLPERADLLGEQFLVGVAACDDAGFGQVGVRMADRPFRCRQRKEFVRRQVELNARDAPREPERTVVVDTAFAIQASSGVLEDLKPKPILGDLDSRLVVDPGRNLTEGLREEVRVHVRAVREREVQVF
jgi:hypothetical protein